MQNRGLWILLALSAGCGGSVSGNTSTAQTKPYEGFVSIDLYNVDAGFFPTGSISLGPATSVAALCAEPMTLSGQCCYSENVLLPPKLPKGVSAGALRVWGEAGGPGALMADATGQYATGNVLIPWHDGDTLDVAASGDVVNAFEGTIQTPSRLVSMPGIQDGIAVDRSRDFAMTWQPDAHPGETVAAYAVFGQGKLQTINCMASDSAGSLTMPADLLSRTQAGQQVITNLWRSATSTMTSDNATVHVTANTLVTWVGTTE